MYTKERPIYRVESPPRARLHRQRWQGTLAVVSLIGVTLLGASLGQGAVPNRTEDVATSGHHQVVANERQSIRAALVLGATTSSATTTVWPGPTPQVAQSDQVPRFVPGFGRPTSTGDRGGAPAHRSAPDAPAFVGSLYQVVPPAAPRFRHLPALLPTPALIPAPVAPPSE